MDLKLVPGACSSDRSALCPTPNSWEASSVWSVELSRIELNMAAQVWDQKGESCASIRPEPEKQSFQPGIQFSQAHSGWRQRPGRTQVLKGQGLGQEF